MVKAMERRFDEHAGQLMKELLRLMYLRTETWAAESNPVPIIEIRDAVNKNLDNNYLSSYIDQYLKIMGEFVCLQTYLCLQTTSLQTNYLYQNAILHFDIEMNSLTRIGHIFIS